MNKNKLVWICVILMAATGLLCGCAFNDGRDKLRGTWVVKDGAIQGGEAGLQQGIYIYMEFEKNGIMYMGTSSTGVFAVYTFRPLAEKGKMMLEQKDADAQTWKFWFEDDHLYMDPDLDGTVSVGEDGVPHEHSADEVPDEPLELIPLDEYLQSLETK